MNTKDKQLKEPSGSIVITPGGPYALEKDIDHVPEHYRLDGLEPYESIDVIKAVLGREGFISFCHGNTLKYLIRCEKKGGVEDLKEAKVYIDWIVEELDGRNED